jgi:hypothetical protein
MRLRLIFFILALLLVPRAAIAQTSTSTCRVRFGVVHLDQRLPGGGLAGLTKHQADWFKKTGAKKFPSLCEDEGKPEYLLLWTSEDASGVVGATAGGNGTVTTVQRDRVRFYIVEGANRDVKTAIYSGEHEDSLMHWADQSALEDAMKFLATKQPKK